MDESKSSKMFLVAAVVLGALSTVMAFAFINTTGNPDGSRKVKIVLAAQNLPPGLPIDPKRDFRVEEIPERMASFANRCVDPAAMMTYKGQKVNRRIEAGTPVFLGDFAAGGELVVGKGMRALSIRAAAGLAATGDHVKILQLGTGQVIGEGDGFKVLAIGITLNTNRNQVTKVEQDAAANPARLVTLEVTDQQAMDIAKKLHTNPENNMLLVTPPPPPTASATQPEK